MGVTLGTFAALAIATLVRALVKPGKIKQAELDLMEAERRAQRDLKRMRGLWGDPRLRAYNGTKRAMQAQMRHHMAQ